MSDANYAIDIAAAMPAGEKTISELSALTKNLLGAGVGADSLHDAVALASNSLAAAAAASSTANAALARGNTELKALEKAALAAAKAEAEVAKLGVVPPEVAASVRAAAQAIEDHRGKLDGLKAAASAASASEKEFAKTLQNVKQAAAAGTAAIREQEAAAKAASAAEVTAFKQAGDAAKKVADEQERAVKQVAAEQLKATKTAEELTGTGKFRKLSEAMGSTEGRALLMGKAAGIAAGAVVGLTVAAAALTAALVAGVVAVTAWAIGLADVNRSAKLSAQAAEALGANLSSVRGLFDELNAETGLGDKALQGLTKRLRDAGVQAGDMAGALRDAALAERALGAGGADDFIAEIKASKGAITGLTNEVRGKLGVIVSKQLLSLDSQAEQFKKNIGSLFGGLNIEPVLEGLRILVSLFDQNTAAGGAMKLLFETVFQPIVDQAKNAALAVEAFALGFLIGLTKVYIAVKPTIRALGELFGFEDTALIDLLGDAKAAGEAIAPVVLGLVAGFTAAAAVVGVLVGALAAVAASFIAIPFAVQAAARAVGELMGNAIKALISAVTGVPGQFNGLGANMMQGLADGIRGAAGAVVGAVTGAVGDAIKSAKSLLGIASPSKVFAEMGGYTAEGFAMGVDDGAGAAQDSLAAMVEPPAVSPIDQAVAGGSSSTAGATADGGAGAAPGGAGSSGGWSGDLILQFPGVTDTKGVEETVREVVTQIWKGDAAQLGAAAAP